MKITIVYQNGPGAPTEISLENGDSSVVMDVLNHVQQQYVAGGTFRNGLPAGQTDRVYDGDRIQQAEGSKGN